MVSEWETYSVNDLMDELILQIKHNTDCVSEINDLRIELLRYKELYRIEKEKNNGGVKKCKMINGKNVK